MIGPKSMYLIHDFPPLSGGMSRYYHNLLRSLPPEEVIAVVTHSADESRTMFPVINANIPLNKNYAALGLYPVWFSILRKAIKRYSPCLIMACSTGLGKMLSVFSTIYPKTRYGIFFHGLDILRERKKATKNTLKMLRLKRLLKRSDIIVTNSEYTASLVKEVVRPKNMAIIHPGVDSSKFRPLGTPKRQLRMALGLPEDGFLLIYVGRAVKRKGLPLILQTIRYLPDNVFLIVIGPGDFKPYADLAREYRVSSRVLFEGYKDDNTLVKFYNASDVFVMPVLKTEDDVEGFGIVYLEASSTGLPVIGSSVGGVKESVKDGTTGFLLKNPSVEELLQRIKLLKEDNELRERMGRAGRKWVVENFQWKLSAEKLRKAYLTICS